MREILFKAQRIDNGEWVEGALFDGENYCVIGQQIKFSPYVENECKIVSYKVDKNTICQFTGLYDKNGKKIWENDIVSHVKYSDSKAKVVYGEFNCSCCNGVYGWTFESIGGYSEICDIRDCGSIEVISTIFDNPELLKGRGEDENRCM